MKKNWIAVLCALALVLSMAGCSGGEETTVTGMVVSLEGTMVTLVEMSGGMENFGGDFPSMFENGEMPTRPEGGEGAGRPEGMEDFTMPEDFDFENFDPENMPEGFNRVEMPEGFDPEKMPEGFEPGSFGGMPGGGDRPQQMPEGGDFSGFQGGMSSMGETTTLDIANARVGIEIEDGKESGSMDDVTPGAMVTITISPKGEATYVLISSSGFSFGGSFMPRT